MIKFGKSLIEYEKKLIEFERKRTILYLSKLNKQKIWINNWIENENTLISGVVKVVINGEIVNNKHSNLGGKFSFDNNVFYSMDNVFAISFKPFSLDDENYKKDCVNMFNSSIYGDEADSKGHILFSWTDLQPQDFSFRTSSEIGSEFTGEFRSYNTRYYESIAKAFRG